MGGIKQSASEAGRGSAERAAPLIDITRGVRPVDDVLSLREAGERVAVLAEEASKSGTFGVGGLLMMKGGIALAEATNTVIVEGRIEDPTAHVERKLVDWYYQKWTDFPSISEMFVLSSLDPCAMCAGSLIAAGFGAISVAEDIDAGVHENGATNRMPGDARRREQLFLFPPPERIEHLFFWPEMEDSAERALKNTELIDRCARAFSGSFANIRARFGAKPEPNAEFTELPRILRGRKELLPEGVRLPPEGLSSVLTLRKDLLKSILAGGRAALIDDQGHMILRADDRASLSPVRRSVPELVRGYTHLANALAGMGVHLPPQTRLSVLLYDLPTSGVEALIQFGAIGSFLERPHEDGTFKAFTYVDHAVNVPDGHADILIGSMPPYYTEGVNLGARSLDEARAVARLNGVLDLLRRNRQE